jgi:serine/threonine protein kinase
MLMELSKQGSLYRKLKIEKKFSESKTGRYMLNVLSAMHFLHQQDPPILHRDLKPENLLMFDNVVKITDFGWSAEQSDVRNTFCGTQEYLAPEMIEGSGHDEKLDVWTLGILVYELIHGKTPFFNAGKGVDVRQQRRMIEQSIMKGKYEMDPKLSKATKDVIRCMLQPKKQNRWTTRQLLDSEFFKQAANPMTKSKSRKALHKQENINMKEVIQLRVKIAELKKQNNDLNDKVKKLEEKLSAGSGKDLTKEMAQVEMEIKKLKEKNEQLENENKEIKQDLEYSKREERTLKQKLNKRQESIAKLEKSGQQIKEVNKFIFQKSKVKLNRNSQK